MCECCPQCGGWVGVIYVAMLMLPRRVHCMSRGIRQPWSWSFPALGNVCSAARSASACEIAADSGTQRPGELCQTRLQDSDTITGAIYPSCSCSLIQIHAHLQEWRAPSGIACRCMETEAKTQPKAKISIFLDPRWEEEICCYCAQRMTACIVNRGHSTSSCCFSLIEG